MPADGTVTTGKDGIVAFPVDDQVASLAAALETPCMTDWTLTATPQFNTTNTQCMLSNQDGGSGAATGWDEQELTGRAWTLDLTLFWQKADAGASATFDPVQIGDKIYVALYPNDKQTGDPIYKGWARIGNVSETASTSTKITQTVQLVGDGALAKSAAA